MTHALFKGDKYFFDYFNYLPIGGGRIRVENGNVFVYGFSGTYGKANHLFAANIIKRCYPSLNVEASHG